MEIIKILNHNGSDAVSAKELYLFLGYNKAAWKRWYTKNIVDNPFAIENEDYQTFNMMLNGNETQDFVLTIEFAKKISMMSKTENGEKARNYFLECEQKLIQQHFSLPKSLPEALRFAADAEEKRIAAEEKSRVLEIENDRLHERTDFVDTVFRADDLLSGSQVCKVLQLPYGNRTLYSKLREKGVFYKNKNEPMQDLVNKGYFKMKETQIKDRVVVTTYFTQKGLGYIAKIMDVVKGKLKMIKISDDPELA